MTASGEALAFSISSKIELTTRTNVIGSENDEHFNKRPWSAVMTGRSDGTGWHEVARQQKWLGHTLISPTNPDLILYCHEGPRNKVEQRMWLVNADGSNQRKLRPEEKPEISIGHESWFKDGIHVCYQVGPDKIGVADTRDGTFREYKAPFTDQHVHASHHGKSFIGDGSDKEPFLNLYQLVDGKLTGRHIFRHDSSFSKQYWHPHPAFSPDDSYVLFTSCRTGNGDVYLIKLPHREGAEGASPKNKQSKPALVQVTNEIKDVEFTGKLVKITLGKNHDRFKLEMTDGTVNLAYIDSQDNQLSFLR